MEQKHEEVDDDEIASSDSFIDDSDEDEPSTSGLDEGVHLEEPLSEEEIEVLIAEFLEVESKAAEAQETLEQESLSKVEAEVREELAQTLSSDDLEKAVAREMAIFREEWEGVLDELEADSSQLLEQLDGAGIELPSLYKWIESQAPNTCCTEAWKRKTHWMGSQVTNDVTESIADAEKYLQIHRPVRKRHGKLLEEGASGFLQRKIAEDENHKVMPTESSEVDWSSFNKIFSDPSSVDDTSFGGKQWASVYLASTPQQAAAMGLKFPGIDEVEEIDDVDGSSDDPFLAAALANERELDLLEEQKRNIKKVKEEDDVHTEKVLQLHLKRKRRRNRSCQEDIGSLVENNSMDTLSANDNTLPVSHKGPSEVGDSPDINNLCKNIKGDVVERMETSKEEKTMVDSSSLVDSENYLSDVIETNGLKRSRDNEEQDDNNKKSRIITIDIDDSPILVNKSSSLISNIAKLDKQSNTHENGGGEVGSFRSEGERFKCTACGDLTVDVHQHPLLKAIICNECNCKLEEKMHVKDLDCSECYCRWCGRNSFLLSCKSCKTLFCTSCIRRNFGDEFLSIVRASGWECCCCSSKLLRPMTLELERALNCTVQIESSGSDDGSDNSDMKIDAPISSRRRRKKGIRRIIDDAELGEETQQKIAIEKERQERLKSLQAQFSDKSWTSNSGSCSLPEGATVEVLGDAVTGYIVNVVREKGEDPVRILPSISAKLKVHQVSGIRFMWENIIQSVRKVKSGDKGLGCILAHTMGLGKTFQVIAFLYTAMRSVDLGLKSALIVTPVNVLHNWRQEFMKWKPTELKPLRVYMLEDVSRERRVELLEKWRAKGGIFLIGYSSFRNLSQGKKMKDRQVAAKISSALHDGPDILVCDEAHMIKNTRADVTQALKQVKCQRRIALTGSPLQNNLMEYYCMVDFVREGFLGSSLEFRNRFQNPIENGQHANSTSVDVKIMNQRSHILYEQLKGFVQRMDTSVVKKDMPPKTVFVIAVKLSPLQRKLYKRFLDVHGFTNDKVSSEKIRKSFFAGYQALAQIWNHPGILQLIKEDKDSERRDEAVENFLADDSSSDENADYNMVIGEKPRNKNEQAKSFSGFLQQDWWNGLLHENNYDEVDYSGKMVLLLDILTMCSDVGDKALVFSQSIRTLDLMEKYLSKLPQKEKIGKYWKKGEDWYRLDGKTAASDRQKLVERFNEPLNKRVKCALISTRAGSLGINLYAANRVIIMDGSWNPTYDLQAIYRAWRYGQKKPVFAYRFVAHGTMEEKIYKRQVTKEGLAARVVDRQQVHRTMSKEEMLHLFEFGDDNLDMSPDFSHDKGHNSSTSGQAGDTLKHKLPLSFGSCSSDKLMDNLLGKHHPKWVANYHEHETLLQENEEEKLSKEEQDMAWEVYRRSLEWEEVSRVPVAEPALEQKPSMSSAGPPAVHSDHSPLMPQSNKGTFAPQTNQAPLAPRSSRPAVPRSILQRHELSRKCTNLSHLLTIRSQGTKFGCSTVCGQCGTEISWEDLNKGSKSAKKNNLHSS